MTIKRPWLKASLVEHALKIAAQGIPVFPCNTDNKRPLTKHGFKDATTDPEQIRKWWGAWPHVLIGMPTGAASGRLVIDLDRKPGHADGVIEWPKLLAEHDETVETLISETPSTGQHWVFQNVEGLRCVALGKLWPGVEIKAEGGYVILPPSQGYKWLNDNPIIAMPQWLVDGILALRAPPKLDDTIDNDGTASDEELALAMKAIPNESDAWSDWNRVAMALWRASGGRAFNLFDEWSKKWHGYNAKDTRDRWRAITRSPPTDLGAGTLFLMAQEADPFWREGGYSIEREEEASRFVAQLLAARKVESEESIPPYLLTVPGLVGEIAQFITDSAQHPQPLMSLAAALGIVATAGGRFFLTPLDGGLSIYFVCLAKTGGGKDHPKSMIDIIMDAAGLDKHVGPDQFISMPAFINFMKREPLAICPQDEFGSYLKRLGHKRANSFEVQVMTVLQQAWSSAGKSLRTPEWAQVPSERIFSPALSIVGFSTEEMFFEALQNKDVASGFLNRFLVFETLNRPPQQVAGINWKEVPLSITKQLKGIYNRRKVNGNMTFLSTAKPGFCKIECSEEAENCRMDLVREVESIKDDQSRDLMVRTAEIALRLATIVTIGIGSDIIELPEMQWAVRFSRWFAKRLVTLSKERIADTENQIMAHEVLRIIKRKANGAAWVKQSDVLQALKHKYRSRDLDDVFKGLRAAGDIIPKQTQPKGGGTTTIWYSVPII